MFTRIKVLKLAFERNADEKSDFRRQDRFLSNNGDGLRLILLLNHKNFLGQALWLTLKKFFKSRTEGRVVSSGANCSKRKTPASAESAPSKHFAPFYTHDTLTYI